MTTTVGHRANYIIVEGGHAVIRYSQFGATSIPSDVLAGPDDTLDYIMSLEHRDELLHPDYAEGAILIDTTRREALFFENTGNHNFFRSPGLRRILVPFIENRWGDWLIRWAKHGWFDIARELNHPFPEAKLRSQPITAAELRECIGVVAWFFGEPIDWRSHRAANGKTPFGYYEETIVTILSERGEVLDFSVGASVEQVLGIGPAAMATLSEAQPTLLPNEVSVREGVLLDVPSRTGWIWWGRPVDPRIVRKISTSWDGWTFQQHDGGFPRQVELSGRDPVKVALYRSVALEQLAEVFGYRAEDMPDAMRRRIQELHDQGAQILHVNPTAIDVGRVPNTTSAKQSILDVLSRI